MVIQSVLLMAVSAPPEWEPISLHVDASHVCIMQGLASLHLLPWVLIFWIRLSWVIPLYSKESFWVFGNVTLFKEISVMGGARWKLMVVSFPGVLSLMSVLWIMTWNDKEYIPDISKLKVILTMPTYIATILTTFNFRDDSCAFSLPQLFDLSVKIEWTISVELLTWNRFMFCTFLGDMNIQRS